MLLKGALRARAAGLWLLGAAAMAGLVVYAAVVPTGQVLPVGSKSTPFSLTVFSSSSLPPEVRAQEAASAPLLFDRDTTTQHVAFAQSSVQAAFEAPQEVAGVKVFGPAPYTLTVQAETAGGGFQTIAGLENVNLTLLPAAWTSFGAAAPVSTAKLQFVLTPASGGTGTGLAELEVWTSAAPVNTKSGAQLLEKLLGPTPPAQGRIHTALNSSATPTQAVVSPGDNNTTLNTNTFRFTLDRDPAHFVRAYLSYELSGQENLISVRRLINESQLMTSQAGGTPVVPNPAWSTQVERINPAVLVRGTNTIKFTVLSTSNKESGYTVRNVRVVGELDNGANAVEELTVNQPDAFGSNAIEGIHDGDLATGWQPYPADQPIDAVAPTVELSLRRPLQFEALSFYLSAPLAGEVQMSLKQAGQWLDFPPETGAVLDIGWNTVYVPATTPPEQRVIEGAKLTFRGGFTSSAEIREFVIVGSGVGGRTRPPKIVIAYPNDGQFYGRSASVQGFVEPYNNGSGNASIFVAGQQIATFGGTIASVRHKDNIGFSTQADNDPWFFEVRATWPNGEVATTVVDLFNQKSQAEALTGTLAGSLATAVTAKTKKTINHDESKLVIDSGTVATDTTITIQPLAEVDVPALDLGMVNVTKGPRRGYRYLPHGARFLKNVNVTLPYDKALIPPGHTEDDVRTYFFDEQAGRWVPLPFVSADKTNKLVNSTTDHFTDMINAVVTVPDHPQAVSFNPTSMKDIKAADPGAQVNLIEPPKGNNQGDARLSYPIEVPPGRQGLQPQLAVQYSSSGGNGWMGMGWDIPMQAVTIDTRFGVPRYEAGLETETYTLSGEMLTPVAHRGELVARTPEKVFHARVEGQFKRIIRRGSHPNNYSWEVTDKNGVKYLYGATDPATETLSDALGNRFLWALCEIRDPNGNFVKFRYAKVTDDPGVVGGQPGSNIYLKSVTYTGHGVTEGLYSVIFTRDRELNEPLRVDKQIDARGGFKRVTADLLRKVEVTFAGALVRRYEFGYNDNPYGDRRPGTAFLKTLLTTVSQFGADGQLFNKHTLTYYDEAREPGGGYRGFAGAAGWGIGDDGIGIGLLGRGTASALGGTQSTSAGGHIYVGIGPYDGQLFDKSNTIGVKVGFSRSSSDTLIAMADMDGDGLPDKVFKGSNGFFYRKNLSGPHGTPTFAETPFRIEGLTAISKERVTSTTVGGESFFGLPVLVDVNFATTHGDTYFSDVNGDGLTDLVSGGTVIFGFVNANKQPVFGPNSADTPVPIGAGAIVTENLLEDAAAIEAERANNYPLLDTLRRWVAPYDGTISVNAPVNLIQDPSPERAEYTGADGVRVAIQLEGAELWSTTIAADDYAPKAPTGVSAVPVLKGQRLYFRVQSIFDGAFDQVAWNPEITYLNVDTTRSDVNDLAEYRYRASEDFTFAGRSGATTVAPLTGTLRLAGTFEKTGVTTDDVRLVITRNGMEVFSRTLGLAEAATVNLAQDLAVSQLDVLEWRIFVDSPIDTTRVRLTPEAFYTAAEGLESVTDEQGNFVVRVTPPYEMDLYTFTPLTAPQGFYTVPAPAVTPLPVQARIQVNGLQSGEIANAVFTVKRRGARLAKVPVLITGTGASPVEVIVSAEVAVNAGDQLFFDLSSRDAAFASKLALLEVTVGAGEIVPSALHTRGEENLFAQPYRGWGAAGYNGNSPRDAAPINQAFLVITEAYDPQNARVYPYASLPAKGLWGGVDELAWVKPGSMSASRLGLDDIRMARSEQFAGQSAPPRISRSVNTSLAVGLSRTTGTSDSQLEFIDLNGDRFPDVLSNGGVQFTRAVGGLEGGRRSGRVQARAAETESFGLSTSGAGSIANAIGDMRAGVSPFGYRPAAGSKQGSDMPTFAAEASGGTSKTGFELIDVNGDGLPDKAFRDGSVALNLGYSFLPAEPWLAGIINDGDSLNGGVSLGFNIGFHSLAGGLSLSTGFSKSDETYTDINGDGLPDKVTAGSVRLNTGAGFTGGIPWPGGHGKIAEDKHISLGGGAYFTVCIPLVPPVIVSKLCFNPGVNFSTSMGRPEVSFRDMDGDGFVDHVFSERDRQLSVALNPIGRTNLLKRVLRPMGATIDLEYTRDGNTFELPQSRWTMTRVATFDGHVGEGADRQVTRYRYSAPNYNRLERDFYGYASVVEEHLDTLSFDSLFRSITREFRTDSYYTKGLLAKETLRDAQNRPFTETENAYLLRNVDTGVEPADGSSTTATIFPQLSRTDKRFFEGLMAAGKSTFTTHTYDALGNVATFTDTGEAGAADDVFATIAYTSCGPSYISKPNRIEVRGNGALMRLREADIDCATGDLRQVRARLADLSAAVTDLTYFANGNLQTVTGPSNRNGQRYTLTYEYDPQVATHVARITDSFGLSSQASYDLRFGKVQSTVDTNGQQTSNLYDEVGRLRQIFGPYEQGQATATLSFDYAPVQTPEYDSTGNVTLLTVVPRAITRHVDKDADGALKDTIDTILFTDGLKRVIQTKKDAAVLEPPASAAQDRMIVSGQVTFDAFGRTVAQRYPITETKASENVNGAFNPGFDSTVPATTMAYDVLDRNTRTTIPDGSFTTLAYGFGTDRSGQVQFETVVTDANVNAGQRGAVKRTYRNVRELITSVKELNKSGTETIWTSYAYDALKQIVQAVDDKLNTTNVAYDNLGRRTVIDNPDAGRTETRYDLASNVTQKITANLRAQARAIDYNYDFNRLTSITYPNFLANNVTYTYGTLAAAGDANGNGAGRITRITSQMGAEERKYGRLGETVHEKKTVANSTGPLPPFETFFKFDTFGRMLRITYPDGEIVTNVYDSGGNLKSAAGVKRVDTQGQNHRYHYLHKLEYDKFEQRAFMEQGNGVKTAYTYDAQTRRLANLNAVRQANVIFQNLTYAYDKVGNVLGLKNDVERPTANTFGGPSLQKFEYDELYRLTKAQGVFQAAVNSGAVDQTACNGSGNSHCRVYALDLTYDTIHNILSKNQADTRFPPGGGGVVQKKSTYDFAYLYAPSGPSSVRPHAPTHIGERTYSYDLNGNQTGWTHDQNGTRRNIVWDDENRIQSLFDNGHEKTYKYDDQGNRVIKRGPQGETVYVNQFYTDRPGATGTKHVYAGTTRVASKMLRQDTPGANPNGKTPFEKDIYFYHPDHLGSSSYITDLNGKLYEALVYFPFGEGWIEENTNVQRTPFHFTSKELDEETGLYYFGARYYDPRTSVWQSADPILAKYLPTGNRERAKNLAGMGGVYTPFNLALYSYGHQNPLTVFDPDGKESVVKGGRIYIIPEDKGVPRIDIPNTVQATGVSHGIGFNVYSTHSYKVETPSDIRGAAGAQAVGEGLRTNPTPGVDQAATPEGARNNAGRIPTGGDVNIVKSFSVPSPDPSKFTDVTVNYTVAGDHSLHEGFVMRYGEIGRDGKITLKSYSEGNAWRQNPMLRPVWGPEVEKVWQQNQREIINDIVQRKPPDQ